MTEDDLARRIRRAKQLGKTRTADEVAKIVKLPKQLVWAALMGGQTFINALKEVPLAMEESR